MGIRDSIKKEALGLTQKAMARLFADEKRATQLASALGAVQRGKQAVDKGQVVLMHQLNFASRSDFKELGKQLSALKRRIRELDARLSKR
jgi:hypothetical protein